MFSGCVIIHGCRKAALKTQIFFIHKAKLAKFTGILKYGAVSFLRPFHFPVTSVGAYGHTV